MSDSPGARLRCGIILAAGDGRRLRPLIHQLRGDHLPKQYVKFGGARSMLEQTYHRAEMLIPPVRLLTVVGQHHLNFPEVTRQLLGRPQGTVIVQPENKETGPGLLLPLMHLSVRHPEAVVVVFPSDHFIIENARFMDHVERAFRALERDHSRLILLGIEPSEAEPEYGYIMPGRQAEDGTTTRVRRVIRFVEKPDRAAAQDLIQRGAVWNTLTMVFHAATLLELVRQVAPALSQAFRRIRQAIGTTVERTVIDEVYRTLAPVNFSKDVLEVVCVQHSIRLSVLPVRGVVWSDWGSATRLMEGLNKTGAMKGGSPLPPRILSRQD